MLGRLWTASTEEEREVEQDLSGERYTVIKLAIRPDRTKERNSLEQEEGGGRRMKARERMSLNETITIVLLRC